MESAHRLKSHKTEQIPCLPDEIVEEILSRLPVKSLLRFRCVIKSWRSLIGSKTFIRAHLENSRRNPTLSFYRTFMKSCSPCSLLKSHCLFPSSMNEYAYTFDNDPFLQTTQFYVVGCCNGLVCILSPTNEFFLWNPSIRMCKKLPDIDVISNDSHITTYGFGFDETNADYKVFAIIKNKSAVNCLTVGRIYSLSTNSWRSVENMAEYSIGQAGTFVNGKLHWIRLNHTTYQREIISFDLEGEVYGIMELPAEMKPCLWPLLVQLEGCLCVFYRNRMTIWVLKQYGVRESWNKIEIDAYGCYLKPLFRNTNGDILFADEFAFSIYCVQDDGFQHPHTVDVVRKVYKAHLYFESLVLPVPNLFSV